MHLRPTLFAQALPSPSSKPADRQRFLSLKRPPSLLLKKRGMCATTLHMFELHVLPINKCFLSLNERKSNPINLLHIPCEQFQLPPL